MMLNFSKQVILREIIVAKIKILPTLVIFAASNHIFFEWYLNCKLKIAKVKQEPRP